MNKRKIAGYDPEAYWSTVALEIAKRGENYVAGDDNPYYQYKRLKFLQMFLDNIDFESKAVLEVGFGPGGNLRHIASRFKPQRLFGIDISQRMLELASKNLSSYDIIELKRNNGTNIPYGDQCMDMSFTVTVLQHITDEAILKELVREICRVTKTTIIIMEDIGKCNTLSGNGAWIDRSIDVYKSIFEESGFQLTHCQFLNTRVSRSWYQLVSAICSWCRVKPHQQGEPIGNFLNFLIGLPLSISRVLDELFIERQDLAKMIFHRL